MLPHPDGIPGPVWINAQGSKIFLEPAFEDYSFMLLDACDAWGFAIDGKCKIYPLMGDVDFYASATKCGNDAVIIYQRQTSREVGYQGAQAIIAHELGHHVCGHLENSNSRRSKELQADAFAGATMKKLGVSLEETLSYLPILSERSSHTHPARSDRAKALIEGWETPDVVAKCS